MPRPRRLLAGLTCCAALTAGSAHAQPAPPASPPETLETPYEDPPVAPPAPATAPAPRAPVAAAPNPVPPASAPVVAPLPADKRPLGPIRARRRLALTGEIGWNGLAGFGPVLTYHLDPHVSLDMGAGLSLLGWKAGVRGRYNFMTTPFTPFLGVGFNATSGFGEFTTDPSQDPSVDMARAPITLDVGPSYMVQAVVGFDFLHRHGFTLVGCLGASILLNRDNVKILAGTPQRDEKQAIDVLFKTGPVVSIATGYAFE